MSSSLSRICGALEAGEFGTVLFIGGISNGLLAFLTFIFYGMMSFSKWTVRLGFNIGSSGKLVVLISGNSCLNFG